MDLRKSRRSVGLLTLLLSTWVLGTSEARAQVFVDLFAAPTFSMATGTPQPTGKLGFPGGGVVLNFRAGRSFDFQVGGAYLNTAWNDGADQTLTAIEGLSGFKWKLSRFLFLQAGGYYHSPLSSTLSTPTPHFGVYGGLGLKIFLSHTVSILLNPQYQYALAAIPSGSGTMVPHQLVGFMGLSFARMGM